MVYIAQESQDSIVEEFQWREKCFEIVGVSHLCALKKWCEKKKIQAETWQLLCNKIYKSAMFPDANIKVSYECCIKEEIDRQSLQSEEICRILNIQIEDLSIAYGCVVIPADRPAYLIIMENGYTYNIYYWNGMYHSDRSDIYGNNDPYTAILELLLPEQIEFAKKIIQSQERFNYNYD